MQQGFARFHSACHHQRQLMIAVECLQHQMEDLKNGVISENENLPEDLMEQIVHLSQAMTVDMENFTWTLFRHTECPEATRQFQEIEGACGELLDANLSVMQTVLAVASQYGHAPWITRAIANIAARTQLIRAQLSEHTEFIPSSMVRVPTQN